MSSPPGSSPGSALGSGSHERIVHSRRQAPPQDSEQAPLLVDGAKDDDVEANGAKGGRTTNAPPSKTKRLKACSQHAWYWVSENLIVVAVACLLVAGVIALFVYFGVMYNKKQAPKPVATCESPECVLAAAELIQSMSPRARQLDPCTSFDKLVCEGWQERHDLRADQGGAFTGSVMAENSQTMLRHILESPYPTDHEDPTLHSTVDEENFNMLKDAYDACMDEEKIKKAGARPLIEILRKIQDLFPAMKPHEDTNPFPIMVNQEPKGFTYLGENQLSDVVVFLMRIGVAPLVEFNIDADDKSPDSVAIMLSAPQRPGLPSKEYYKDGSILASYSKTIGQVLEGLLREAEHPSSSEHGSQDIFAGSGVPSVFNQDLVKALVDFETQLAEVTPDAEEASDVTKYYNPRTLDEARALLPQLSIPFIISSLASSDYKADRIIVGSPSYLKSVSSILHSTTKETLQAYLVWKTVQAWATKVEHEALKPLTRFNNELRGKDPDAMEERWRICVREADDSLGWILSRFFVEKAFSDEAQDFGNQIVADIREQYIKKLDAAEWMSKDVRELGIEKVRNIVQKIGFPKKSPSIREPAALRDYYASLNISSSDFFNNAISTAKFQTNHEWNKLGKPTDRDEWIMTAPTVNAYYNPVGNEIVFPAGIMQSPVFYHPSIPQYLSYGSFGAVSGHELSHAFDSSGRHYSPNGTFTDWWNNQTVQSFKEKAQCFVDQYHEFTVPGLDDEPLHVNGRLTLGENIADAGGLSASFAAWKQRELDHPAQLLPGFRDYTKEQVFFISYANFWCGKTRKEVAVERIYQDPHSPNWARILGTIANSRDFAESFNCPNKEPTCELW